MNADQKIHRGVAARFRFSCSEKDRFDTEIAESAERRKTRLGAECRVGLTYLSDAMSITKRYFTSLFSIRS